MFEIKRHPQNPILKPDPKYSWQAAAVFNGCPIKHDNCTHLLFRAYSLPQYHAIAGAHMPISTIGHATSDDGINYQNRQVLLVPKYEWERYGCEDPRVTKIDDTYFIFYTALSTYPFTADGIKVGVALTKDLKNIDEKHLVTPFNAKAMTLFPEKINGKLTAILSVNTDKPPSRMGIIQFDSVEQIWDQDHWNSWYKTHQKHSINLKREDDDHCEIGAPPIKTKDGWLLIYSHINHYGKDEMLFGIEAVLLDLNDPTKVIHRTSHPLMIPEDYHELYGMVPNVIFPSGAQLEGDELQIHYGAADTTCCMATTSLQGLLNHMKQDCHKQYSFVRSKKNPIITPKPQNAWEAFATFNPAAFYADNKIHIVYRAMSHDYTSVMGYATSKDGETIDERLDEPIYLPRKDFEMKNGDGNSGCEDPRITLLEDTLYMCYTAFDGRRPPRVALTSISLKDFLKRKWKNWKEPVLISAPGLDDKDAAVFPEKVNDKYLILHRIGDDIDIAFTETLDLDGKTWIEEQRWLKQRRERWDNRKVGIAAPPFKTEKGWVLLYHGVSKEDKTYRVGAVLLDLADPTKILARSDHPLFEPKTPYELEGIVNNVVFPCGNVLLNDKVFIYYGGADEVLGVATIPVKDLLDSFNV